MRPRPTGPAIGIPGRRATVVVGKEDTGGLLGPGFRLDRPVDDPAEVKDGDLHDHHQPDQLPHYGVECTPENHPATWASSFPLNSSFPWLSYCVTSKVARARLDWTPRAEAMRTGSPASAS